jgi:hypothetical protein
VLTWGGWWLDGKGGQAVLRLGAQGPGVSPHGGLVGWPVTRRVGSGGSTVIGVTGRVAVCAAVGEGGTARCSARPPVFMELSDWFRAGLWPLRGRSGHLIPGLRTCPKPFCWDQHPARGVDRENTAAGPGAPESLGTVTKAGEG